MTRSIPTSRRFCYVQEKAPVSFRYQEHGPTGETIVVQNKLPNQKEVFLPARRASPPGVEPGHHKQLAFKRISHTRK